MGIAVALEFSEEITEDDTVKIHSSKADQNCNPIGIL